MEKEIYRKTPLGYTCNACNYFHIQKTNVLDHVVSEHMSDLIEKKSSEEYVCKLCHDCSKD